MRLRVQKSAKLRIWQRDLLPQFTSTIGTGNYSSLYVTWQLLISEACECRLAGIYFQKGLVVQRSMPSVNTAPRPFPDVCCFQRNPRPFLFPVFVWSIADCLYEQGIRRCNVPKYIGSSTIADIAIPYS